MNECEKEVASINLSNAIKASKIGKYIDEETIEKELENYDIQSTSIPSYLKDQTIFVNSQHSDEEESYCFLKTAIQAIGVQYQQEDELLLQNAIAGYFAAISNPSQIQKKDYMKKDFYFLTPYSNILETIIWEIAPIVGEKNLAEALRNSNLIIYAMINDKTKSNLGVKLSQLIESLCLLAIDEAKLAKVVNFNRRLYDSKLSFILDIINQNKTYPFRDLSINMLLKNDLNLAQTFHRDNINPEYELTEGEKRVIRKYIEESNNLTRSQLFQSQVHDTLYRPLFGHYAKLNEFDKVNNMTMYLSTTLDTVRQNFLKTWQEIQILIIHKILPRSETDVDIMSLAEMGSYSDQNGTFDLRNSSKTHKIKRKNNL